LDALPGFYPNSSSLVFFLPGKEGLPLVKPGPDYEFILIGFEIYFHEVTRKVKGKDYPTKFQFTRVYIYDGENWKVVAVQLTPSDKSKHKNKGLE
jgi:hypothetical protein